MSTEIIHGIKKSDKVAKAQRGKVNKSSDLVVPFTEGNSIYPDNRRDQDVFKFLLSKGG